MGLRQIFWDWLLRGVELDVDDRAAFDEAVHRAAGGAPRNRVRVPNRAPSSAAIHQAYQRVRPDVGEMLSPEVPTSKYDSVAVVSPMAARALEELDDQFVDPPDDDSSFRQRMGSNYQVRNGKPWGGGR